MVRGWVSGQGGLAASDAQAKPIRYTFKNFPGDKSCNDKLYKTFFEFGCLTARAAEAAGKLGGEAAYWKMHDWLMNNPKPMGLDTIKKAARAIGLDSDAVVTAMNDPAVTAAIQEDIAAGNAIGVGQIPAVYVNGKFLKNWKRDNDIVLERVIDDAAGKGGK
jgi:protein-disulfide isomerase